MEKQFGQTCYPYGRRIDILSPHAEWTAAAVAILNSAARSAWDWQPSDPVARHSAGPLYRVLASSLIAMNNCRARELANAPSSAEAQNAREWYGKHRDTIDQLVKDYMPSGCGWDCGTKFDFDASKPDRLVFHGSYHHMNDGGMYDGWTDHTVTCRASLAFGCELHISGRDRNQIKDYLSDLFLSCLQTEMVAVMGRGYVSAERLEREAQAATSGE